MKVKINDRIICIPPYISTTWDQVAFLNTEEDLFTKQSTLVLNLFDGKVIKIPNLDSSIIEVAFSAHMKYIEGQTNQKKESKVPPSFPQLAGLNPDQVISMPIRFGIQGLPGGIEGMDSTMQHNPAQADTPDLPKEMLDKIAMIAKTLTNGDVSSFPKPEPHCNCAHCQVAKAVHGESAEVVEEQEEVVSLEDLQFRNWDILQTGDNLYAVTNPLDPREHYSVFLGTPVGCTCGSPHCEHIKAVLSS